jgi:hypothetical protein
MRTVSANTRVKLHPTIILRCAVPQQEYGDSPYDAPQVWDRLNNSLVIWGRLGTEDDMKSLTTVSERQSLDSSSKTFR